MKTQLKPIAILLSVAGILSTPVLAAVSSDSTNAQNKALLMRLASLEKKINYLQGELDAKSNTQSSSQKKTTTHRKHVSTVKSAQQANPATSTASSPAEAHMQGSDLLKLIGESKEYLPFDLDVPGQAFVSTGPYVGVPIQYAGSNLIINSPSVNTDLQLLNIRKKIHQQLMTMMGDQPFKADHSHLLFSGLVESQANYTNHGGAPSTSDIDVTNMSLDAFFLGPSNWLQGFIEFSYDNGLPSGSSYRVSNSHVYVNKAFATIGDFTVSPFYGSVGQFYVPFGTYSSVMVSDTLTKLLARTKARSILVGMQQQGDNAFYGAGYIFRGDSHAASVSKINNGGINLGYKFKQGIFGGNIGAGVLANLADSGGMQLGTGFQSYEQLSHRVPAYNLRGTFSIGEHVDLIAEYVGASKEFSPNDMSFNGHGAKPWAIDTEAAYSFTILDNKPSSIGIGYGKSTEALALGIPLARYSLVFNTSLWRNTLESLEFRHDRNYAASNTANGPIGAAVTPGACTAAACSESGKSDNAVTAQFDYYF